jgi:hypothetical protein
MLREVNREIFVLARSFESGAEYICECGDVTCSMATVPLEPREIADVLGLMDCLLVAPGHELPGAEVVRRGRGYAVVRAREVRSLE